jgi:delta(3,5)-delta(2,4)-dienoyl-CoA isomerase
MWLELRKIFDQLSHDSSVRAVVLSGAGDRAFTAGLDVKAASQNGPLSGTKGGSEDGARTAVRLRRHILEFQDCVTALERCEKPVVVVMHGFSLGLAIDLSSCADVRICARDTKFAVKEVDIGLAADIGTLTRLPKVVGHFGWVKEVALSARIFGAEEALRVGFVNAVHDTKADALRAGLKLAGLIASKSPVAVQGTKELLNWSRDHPVQDGRQCPFPWFYDSSSVCNGTIPAEPEYLQPPRPPLYRCLEQCCRPVGRCGLRHALRAPEAHSNVREVVDVLANYI